MIRIGVIGYGYWGPNLARNIQESSTCKLAGIADLRPERLSAAAPKHPGAKLYTDPQALLQDPGIDAVAVSTPVSTHFDLALRALRAGKHVLVEKPMTSTSAEARTLIDEARRRGLVLMVDHTFVYTGAVAKLRELSQSDQLGDVYYYDSTRVNLGLFSHDVSVLWDLAVHDLSILDYVLGLSPRAVSATGLSHVPGMPANVAYLTLLFDAKVIAHVTVNWLAPVKVRRTLIGGSRRMIVYDDLEPSEKIKVYDRGITVGENPERIYQARVGYRTGDMWSPRLDMTEALQAEIGHFAACILSGEKPRTDGEAGLRVIRVLEAASRSMAENGRPVELDSAEVAA